MAKRKKKKRSLRTGLKYQVYGILLIAVGVIALTGEATVGRSLVSLFSLVIGKFYFLAPLLIITIGLYLMVKMMWPLGWTQRRTGALLIVMGMTLTSAISVISQKFVGLPAADITSLTIFSSLSTDISSSLFNLNPLSENDVTPVGLPTGGGYLGALQYAFLFLLFGKYGSIFVTIVMFAIGIMLLVGISYVDMITWLIQRVKRTYSLLRTKLVSSRKPGRPARRVRGTAEDAADLAARKRHKQASLDDWDEDDEDDEPFHPNAKRGLYDDEDDEDDEAVETLLAGKAQASDRARMWADEQEHAPADGRAMQRTSTSASTRQRPRGLGHMGDWWARLDLTGRTRRWLGLEAPAGGAERSAETRAGSVGASSLRVGSPQGSQYASHDAEDEIEDDVDYDDRLYDEFTRDDELDEQDERAVRAQSAASSAQAALLHRAVTEGGAVDAEQYIDRAYYNKPKRIKGIDVPLDEPAAAGPDGGRVKPDMYAGTQGTTAYPAIEAQGNRRTVRLSSVNGTPRSVSSSEGDNLSGGGAGSSSGRAEDSKAAAQGFRSPSGNDGVGSTAQASGGLSGGLSGGADRSDGGLSGGADRSHGGLSGSTTRPSSTVRDGGEWTDGTLRMSGGMPGAQFGEAATTTTTTAGALGVEPALAAGNLLEPSATGAIAGVANAANSAPALIEQLELPYLLPPYDLLDRPQKTRAVGNVHRAKEKLEQTFEAFGVKAKVNEPIVGPAVTRFEVEPGTGVKVSRIVGLTDDIALQLAAKDIRMEAPVPGKSVIGIEVPNLKISTVSLREVLESEEFIRNKSKLAIGLGKDITGQAIVGDLASMPHLLVAGATGSGKSVCINGIIASILYHATPDEVKFLMVDPKMVELNIYNGIPHLMAPVVTDPRQASMALKKIVVEMEKRYDLFAKTGTRNLKSYNRLMKAHGGIQIHQIVVIVDELADLMMVAAKDVEDSIARLAQMARASGIHLILATQRPSVDVITGLIKANIPSRIAFGVSSSVDSRTILDSGGAEKLLGRGDMLYLPVDRSKPIRVQGAFVSDQEVERITTYVRTQGEASYDENLLPALESAVQEDKPVQDVLYEDALAHVLEVQQASISMLQRKLSIGYNRAAKLIEQLEAEGIVSPSEKGKPRREVLLTLEQYTMRQISS